MTWVVAEDDMVVVFHHVLRNAAGSVAVRHSNPPSAPIDTSFMLAFRFDDDGQIVDQWLGSNFVEMLAQLGWGFAPIGEPSRASALSRRSSTTSSRVSLAAPACCDDRTEW